MIYAVIGYPLQRFQFFCKSTGAINDLEDKICIQIYS